MKVTRNLMIVVLGLLCFVTSGWATESGKTVKEGVKGVMTGIVSTGKDALSGISEGVDEGRKEGDSLDNAQLVSNKTDFNKYLSATVIKMESVGEDAVKVTIAIRNDNEFPVRIGKLGEIRSVVLLDKDGFSYALPDALEQGRDITALGKSLTRARFSFSGVEGEPATLRLFDTDLAVSEKAAASK